MMATSGTVNAIVFTCSICGEPSSNICAYCTKDACSNHRCERCKRCSDCCECEVPLSAEEAAPLGAVDEPAPEPTVESPTADFVTPFEPGPLTESTALAEPRDPIDLE
jgi:hypothetical protein